MLGLESTISRVGLLDSIAGLSLPLGEVVEIIEERLSETEWPGRVVAVLDASLETMDSGRGMYSSVSEKPTRALVPDLAGFGLSSAGGLSSSLTSPASFSFEADGGGGCGGSTGASLASRDMKSWCSKFVGLVGALPPIPIGLTGGGSSGKSLVEMALETPRRWPLRGGWNVGDANPLSDLVGLVLMTAIEFPSRSRPPTNSLPPLRWPWPGGRFCEGPVRGELGVIGGLRSMGELGSGGRDAPGLKLKTGRATDLRALSVSSGGRLKDESWGSMADAGRRPVAREKDEGAEEGASKRMGKVKAGFGGGPSAWCAAWRVGEADGESSEEAKRR